MEHMAASSPRAAGTITILLLLLLLFLGSQLAVASGATEPDPGELKPLTVGIMPAVDSIPLIVASAEGFFEDEGLTVALELFRDQLYREASLQSGRVDAAVSDLVNAIRSRANGADYRVLANTQGLFALLTAPQSSIRTLGDWSAGSEAVNTGVIEDSVIFYTAEKMLREQGADPSRISIIPTLQIPVRLELLLAGELEAAVLPEPVAALAESRGAHAIADSQVLDATAGIIIATGAAVAGKRVELTALLRAYDRAVEVVNRDPDAYRQLITEAAGFPPPVTGSMRIPRFRPARVPSPSLVEDVGRWMVARGLVSTGPEYDELVLPLLE
jgi:NitT/TauT family transport system substrate-binding protein